MHDHPSESGTKARRVPWNKGKLIGQKPPLKLKEIWAVRIRLQIARRIRDLALFNLAIDSKLRGCDLVRLRLRDVAHGEHVVSRATVLQQKTGQPVRFELTEQTREAVRAWIAERSLSAGDFLFPSRHRQSPHISTRQYARIVNAWVSLIGLDPHDYGTHSLRRTKATLIYRRTKNLRAVQLLLGIESRCSSQRPDIREQSNLTAKERNACKPRRSPYRTFSFGTPASPTTAPMVASVCVTAGSESRKIACLSYRDNSLCSAPDCLFTASDR